MQGAEYCARINSGIRGRLRAAVAGHAFVGLLGQTDVFAPMAPPFFRASVDRRADRLICPVDGPTE